MKAMVRSRLFCFPVKDERELIEKGGANTSKRLESMMPTGRAEVANLQLASPSYATNKLHDSS